MKLIFFLSWRNICRNRSKSILILCITVITTLGIFMISSIQNSLTAGLESVNKRAGADIILIPSAYSGSMCDSFFTGTPCSAYFDINNVNNISDIDGINQISSQLYLASLSSSCCDNKIQLVGLDCDTDFSVSPWLAEQGKKLELNEFDMIVGSGFTYEVGDKAMFYGKEFNVVYKLQKSGMGYDNCAFISFETAHMLTNMDVVKNYFGLEGKQDYVSMMLISLKDGYSIEEVTKEISDTVSDEITALTSDELVSNIKTSVNGYSVFSHSTKIFLIVMALVSLTCLFILITGQRKNEIGSYYTIGAKKSQLLCMLLLETAILSAVGGIVGSALGEFVFILYQNYLKYKLELPFLSPDITKIVILSLECAGIILAAAIISAAVAYVSLGVCEPDSLISDDEKR